MICTFNSKQIIYFDFQTKVSTFLIWKLISQKLFGVSKWNEADYLSEKFLQKIVWFFIYAYHHSIIKTRLDRMQNKKAWDKKEIIKMTVLNVN